MSKSKGLDGLWKGIPAVKFQHADDDECVIGTDYGEFSMELNAKNQVVVWIDGVRTASFSLNADQVGVVTEFLTKAHARMVKKQNKAR